MPTIKELLEKQQITIYFMTIVVAIILASCIQGTSVLVIVINPVLAFIYKKWAYRPFFIDLIVSKLNLFQTMDKLSDNPLFAKFGD